jgi:hypothetical protein
MGFKGSWIGFKGVNKAAVLAHLGFRDIGKPDEWCEAPFSLAEIPTGWTILFSNDFDFASAEHLSQMSANMTVVACQVHEGIMFSSAYGYENRQERWGVWHDGGGRGTRDLTTVGSLPAAFVDIRQRQLAQQDAEGKRLAALPPAQQDGDKTDSRLLQLQNLLSPQLQAGSKLKMLDPNAMAVDYIFDIPVDLAEAMTGYRHDRVKFTWGEPRFTIVERAAG